MAAMAAPNTVTADAELTFYLPDLSGLSEKERLQVIAVMQRAKEFEENEEGKNLRQPLEGQLNKYTNVMKGWQYRWFVLDPASGFLEYFEKEEHKKQRPRGSIYLAAAVVAPSDEDSQTFSISAANGEVYRLRAVNAKERQHWVDRLRGTAEYHTKLIAQQAAHTPKPEAYSLTAPPREGSHLKRHDSGSSRRSNLGSNESIQRSGKPVGGGQPFVADPFQEVRGHINSAENFCRELGAKIEELPYAGDALTGLDKDLLLLKATSTATINCLNRCLQLLQGNQNAAITGIFCRNSPRHRPASADSVKTDIIPPTQAVAMNINPLGAASPSDSYVSASSSPFCPEDGHYDGLVNHEEEMEEEVEYHDSELGAVEEHKSVILHLLSQLKLGMDLTKVVLPTFILERRSLLEMFADCMAHPDLFLRIPDFETPEARMMAVVEWYLTSFHAGRQGSLAKKPYNPIIGETFHCSWKVPGETEDGRKQTTLLTYCAEQVSHHPPVSAFYFECPDKQVCMNASIWTKSKFMGMSIGVVMVGKVRLRLLQHDEEYVFGLPSAYARSILTVPWVELGDRVSITCEKTGYTASIVFHTKPFYGGKLHRISGEVKNINSGAVLCKLQGEWNGTIELASEDVKIVDTQQLKVHHKRVRPLKKQSDFESRKLWEHVTNALKMGDVQTATAHKMVLEERQREGEKLRKETGTTFPSKFFHQEGEQWIYKDMLQKGQA